MAARSRRTQFAASFVVVVTGTACSHDRPTSVPPNNGSGSSEPLVSWTVRRSDDGHCSALPYVDCSHATNGATCNPPASTPVPCPPTMPTSGGLSLTIISYDGSHCLLRDDQTPITCPGAAADVPPDAALDAAEAPQATFEPRSWRITAGAATTCYASSSAEVHCPAGATCNPPPPAVVKCPPYAPGELVEEIAPDKCQTVFIQGGGNCPPGLHCNPPPPRRIDVPCPP